MNKKLKIATIAVSVVMAGTMAFGMFGCGSGDNGGDNGGNPGGTTPTPETPVARTDINYDENYRLTYAANTPLNMAVGNGKTDQQTITYRVKEVKGTVTLVDGVEYNQGDLKPAWKALQSQLNVQFSDVYTFDSSDKALTEPIAQGNIANYDIITASASAITQNTDQLVNLNDYLDYMPNYKAFLEANPVTRWSLTSNPSTGAMYYAPYYDGNDDIEKYVMAEQAWVEKLLDATAGEGTVTYAEQAAAKSLTATSTSAQSYMGTTGSWAVATSKPGDTSAVPAVGYVKVDYDAVISALKDSASPLASAISAATSTAISQTSGNIVDIQNAVINATNGTVTGGQLLKITQEYIKVAYKYSDTESGTYSQLYGTTVGGVTTKLSDVFNSTYAAWDVDLMTAIFRCTVTNPELLGATSDNLNNIYGLAARQATTQRRFDLSAFAGELFGIRGMESRYEYMYIGADGSIKDARLNADSYELISRLSALADEGLIYTGDKKMDGSDRNNFADTSNVCGLMMHDYSNTQSKPNWTTTTKLAPISTPVSKWDTDDNGSHETIMRFTESWRSVKNTGFCLTKEGAASSKDKLSACLALIDYMFSNDGQILMTYGPQSSTEAGGAGSNGWWYGTEGLNISDNLDKVTKISDESSYAPAQYEVKANADGSKDYFAYNGKLYKGQAYAGGYVPKMTTASSTFYKTGTYGSIAMGGNELAANGKQNYTNYARLIIGTTLPIGNKNQGFEYQATEEFALQGTANVGKNLLNGTIKHVKLSVDEGESLWYMICPTSFALDASTQEFMKSVAQTDISGKYFLNASKTANGATNLYIDILYYGFDTSKDICGMAAYGKIPASGAACVEFLNAKVEGASVGNMQARVNAINLAWAKTKTAFNIG